MTARALVRFLGATAVAALLVVGLTGVGAGATVHRALSADDCDALQNVADNVDSGSGSGSIFGKQARALADGFSETASQVDNRKLKRNLQTMASFYDDLADANNLLDAGKVTVSEGKRYAKALKGFAKAEVSCATASITVPSNITLPGGVTIPTLPR